MKNSESPTAIDPDAVRQLAFFFRRNGYIRWMNETRHELEGHRKYKKGDEVRFVAQTEEELELIRRLLIAAGFRPGSPYLQAGRTRQPVYGRKQVKRFLELISLIDSNLEDTWAVPSDPTHEQRSCPQ